MRLHSNKYVEALLYISVPLAVHVLLTPRLMRRALRQTKALIVGNPDKGYVVREIESKKRVFSWYAEIDPGHALTNMLQRAIALYLSERMALESTRASVVYQLMDKPLELLLAKGAAGNDRKKMLGDDDDAVTVDGDDNSDSEDEKADDDDGACSYEQLLRLRVAASPAPDTWTEVEPGVFFQYVVDGNGVSPDEEPQNDKESKTITTTFRFRSKLANASQAIDSLVEKAFLNYQKRQIIKASQDTVRYMFIQSIEEQNPAAAASGGDDSGSSGDPAVAPAKKIMYKRYALGEDKSFRTLFFEEKPRVLNLLDNFTQKRGKFAIQGFPYKLGLLLHGPPGTGKTSLIKAIAQHTKRHIVSINLSKIKTNQELLDAMMDLRFAVEGRDVPIVLEFKDVVFVMEDIDCAGASVVAARAAPSEKGKAENDGNAPRERRRRVMAPAASSRADDKLNLSGLLNVLDGVIDCPGRIVVMTTNHPEKLDPALVRPGRVNAQLFLGNMPASQVEKMLEHYFSTKLTSSQCKEITDVMDNGAVSFTPAEVEELCAEYDTVEEIIHVLQQAAGV